MVGGQVEGGVQEWEVRVSETDNEGRQERYMYSDGEVEAESATHRSLVGALVVPVEFRALGTRVRDLAPVVVGRRRWGLRHCRLDGRVYKGQQ